MQRIKEIPAPLGPAQAVPLAPSIGSTDAVSFTGWVMKAQKMKKQTFLQIRDGPETADKVQVVVPVELSSDELVAEAYVCITGKPSLLPAKARSYKSFEIQASGVQIIGKSDTDFSSRCPPDAGPDVRLTERHLYLRDEKFSVITKIRAMLVAALRRTFEDMTCTEIFPPSFVGNQCEGGATLFKLKYPDATKGDIDAYLSQSSQFYLEYAAPALGDVYCIAPSFRAERSHTRRHLLEFMHAECEWVGILTFEQHLEKLRQLLIGTVTHFRTLAGKLVEQLDPRLVARLDKLVAMTQDIVILTHADAIKKCREYGIKDPDTGKDFTDRADIPEMAERALIDKMDKIVFLVKFPGEFKSFYMCPDPDDPTRVLGCDVETPGVGEIIGSGVRVYDKDMLIQKLKAQGLKEEEYREYIDLRRYGFSRTSGMGLGVDRMLTWLLDCHSIRDVVTFVRVPGRILP